MAIRRIDPKALKTLEDRDSRQKAQIRKLSDLTGRFDGEFWVGIVERLDLWIKAEREIRNASYEKATEAELKVSIARESVLERVKRMPADVQDTLIKFQKENTELQKRIRGYRQRTKAGD